MFCTMATVPTATLIESDLNPPALRCAMMSVKLAVMTGKIQSGLALNKYEIIAAKTQRRSGRYKFSSVRHGLPARKLFSTGSSCMAKKKRSEEKIAAG